MAFPFEVVEDLANQFTNARARLKPSYLTKAVVVPAVWAGLFFGASVYLLSRRDITRP